MSSTIHKNLAPNTVTREQFVSAVTDMAKQVWDFHNRWGFGSGGFKEAQPAQIIDERREILAEEIRELDEAVANDDSLAIGAEAGDVLFVAMGHVEALGDLGLQGVEGVTYKNSLKTEETHAIREDTGKLLPKKGKPHKWS